MSDSTFGFIGLGLIGGSIARGLRRANKDITIMAYMRTRSKLEQAKKEGTIDIILDGIDETLSACDIIFLCTPVEYNAMYLKTGCHYHGYRQHKDRHPQGCGTSRI